MNLPSGLRFAILTRDRFACRYCGQRPPHVTLEVDHVIPRSLGGGDDEANLVTACRACNNGKRDQLVPEAFTFTASSALACPTRLCIATAAALLRSTYRWVREERIRAGQQVPPPARGDRDLPASIGRSLSAQMAYLAMGEL